MIIPEYVYLYGNHNPFSAEQLERYPIIDRTRSDRISLFQIIDDVERYNYTEYDLLVVLDPGWQSVGLHPPRSIQYQREQFAKLGSNHVTNDDTVLVLQHLCALRRLRRNFSRDQLHIHTDESYRDVLEAADYPKDKQIVSTYCAYELCNVTDSRTLEQLDNDLNHKLGMLTR